MSFNLGWALQFMHVKKWYLAQGVKSLQLQWFWPFICCYHLNLKAVGVGPEVGKCRW